MKMDSDTSVIRWRRVFYSILDGDILAGELPPNKHKLVKDLINENKKIDA